MANPMPKKHPWRDMPWDLSSCIDENGALKAGDDGLLVLLLDIREELKRLNKTLSEASIFVNGKVG